VQRVIHRDIKPLNLFVDARDRIKIGDMGVSRIVRSVYL
jgi:serine/threonine protein kinase